jgi:hypothetical protein
LKKTAVFLAFFLLCGTVFAQSYRETRIYVPPLDGVGFIDDMALFYKRITAEIIMQYRSLGKARVLSDYVITGKVMPLEEVEITMPPDTEGDRYVLFVELFDNSINETIGEQYITYEIPDANTEEALSVVLYNLLSAIPDVIELYGEEDNWRNKFVYLDLSFLWTPQVYSATFQSVYISSVGIEVKTSFHVLDFLSIRVGAELVPEWVVIYASESNYTQDIIIDFPVAVAYVLRPMQNIMLEPYLGAKFNLSLQKVTHPYPFSWLAGIELGLRAGYGILTVDPRFAMDFGRSYIVDAPQEYWRYTIHLGVGYKIGFQQK